MQCCSKGVLLLLAVLVCSAAATLDQEERQKEERARESAREHEKGGADDIPGMPENLQVRPQGPSAMLVTWSEPSSGDADHYFVYVEGKDLEDNTKIPFKIWEDLEPCTTYTFGVKSVSSKGDLSDPALQDGLTDADRPPEPQYPRVEDYTHTAVTLAWEEPDTQCDIVLYRVRYKDDGPQTNETQVTDTTVKVSHLMPETVYTFNIYASTSEGEGPAASVKQTTAPHPGGPPQDLVAEGISSSVINVRWSEPQTPPNYYLLTAANCNYNEVEVTDLTFTIENLEPCQKCYISVDSYYSDTGTKFQEMTLAETNNDAPPEPRNLQVKNYTDTSMTLAWEKPDTQCDIVQYRVSYIDDDSQTNEIQGNETTVKVSDLFPETNYTFNIYASTSTGEGPAASVKHATAPDPGGPPQDLVAEGISSSAINVSWSEPYSPPSYYLLTAANCNYNEELVYVTNFIIENLEPCQRCYITVTSYYEDTDSRFTATTVAEASGGAPPAPNECSVEVKQNFITVTWEKPITPCGLGPYNVSWTLKKLWGNGEEESDSTNTPGKSYTIYNPPPYHKYTFEIAASIDEFFGSPTSCNATSLESASGPPVLVSVESEKQGEARVIWERPAEENGKIIHYGIFVNDETNYTKQVSGDVFNTTVSLTPCVNVDISVAARNGAVNNEGWGERSEVMNVTAIGDVLPKSLDCPEPEPEVKVCWRPFDEDCPVTQYNLKWEGDVLWSSGKKDSNSTTLGWDEDEICYTIPSTPYTKYNIELTVGTKLDEAIQCSSTTPMAAPGPPILEELQTEGLVITVTWQAPLEKNGNITNYQVEWIDWNDEQNLHTTDGNIFSNQIVQPSCGGEVKVTVKAMTVEYGERSPPRSAFLVNSISSLTCKATKPGVIALNWKVEDLQCPVTLYNITWTFDSLWSVDTGSGFQTVGGHNLSAALEPLPPYSTISADVHVDNSPEKTTCTATTLDEPSSPPLDVELVANGTHSVTVAWSCPEEVRGKLTGWHLTWNTSSGNVADPNNMTFQVEGLSSSTTYVVNVMAVNGAGFGKPQSIIVTTETAPKKSQLGLILGASIGGAFVLIIIAISGFVVYRKKNQTKPPRSAPFMPDVIDSDNDELYKKQHKSSANQRFQGKGETIDFGTNRELYPDNNRVQDPPNEASIDDEMIDELNTVPGNIANVFEMAGDRRLSHQVPRSLSKLSEYDRRPSQMVNMRMKNYKEYNRRSSQPNITEPSEFGMHNRPNFGEYGRRPSQQVEIGRPNLKKNGRRPSQQIDVPRPNPMDHGSRFSQQIDPRRPRLGEYGRRPSQQIDLSRPNAREYARRPSQQIEMGRPRSGEYARRPSQQVNISGRSLPSRAPQQPIPASSGYDNYRRRPSQQTDIGIPNDRAFMRRPSQQFVRNFHGISE